MVTDSLARLLNELALLAGHTGKTLARLAAPILGLMLLGWSAHEVSLLVASELSSTWPWAVIAVLSTGIVLQLATVLALLRVVAVDLGIPTTLASAAAEVGGDERDTSMLQLMTVTLIPFLAIYATFGFVNEYAASLVKLSAVRKGLDDFLGQMNPLKDPMVLVWTVVLLAVGYGFKLLSDRWRERSRHPLLIGMVQIFVQAALTLLVLLVAFRILEAIQIWLDSRAFRGWLDAALGWLGGLVNFDLPEFLDSAWHFWWDTIWPVLFDGFSRPLLWLAMAGLVFGTRLLSLADLWLLGESAAEATSRHQNVLARLQADTARARGVRQVALRAQEMFLGSVEETILPAWQSLRLVLQAGWPFLGAFVIAFTLVDVGGIQLEQLVYQLVGGHRYDFWLRWLPLLDLTQNVLMMGVLWVLLGVAYSRAISIFAEKAGEEVEGTLLASKSSVSQAFRSGPVQAITVLAMTSAVVIAAAQLPVLGRATSHAAIMESAEVHGQQVRVGEPTLARSFDDRGTTITTDLVFVVVPVAVSAPGPKPRSVKAILVSGDRSYPTWSSYGTPSPPPGFKAAVDVVFEVDPDDIGPDTVLVVQPRDLFVIFPQEIEVPLRFTDDQAASAEPRTVVNSTPVEAAA